MPRAIMVTSGKGGTGKTTVSILLARALCSRGKNVLLIELDSGLRGMDLLLGLSDRVVYDLADVLMGRCRPVKAIHDVPVPHGNLHLIAAPVDRLFLPDRRSLGKLFGGLAECYDLLLLDLPAGLGKGMEVAAAVCDGALVVTQCEPVALRGAALVSQMARGLSPRLVINRFCGRQLGGELPHLDAAVDRAGARLIAVVPEDPAVAAGCRGEGNPASPAQLAVGDLSRRILGEDLPLNRRHLR